jgi:outer membrane immunogenic protein
VLGFHGLPSSLAMSQCADVDSKFSRAPVFRDFLPSGFYIGGVAGAGLHTATLGDPYEHWSYTDTTQKGAAFNIGATLGYNGQFGSFVLGAEGDWSWTNFKHDSYGYEEEAQIHSKWDSFATVRGRAGWAVSNVLVYATGGVVFADVTNTAQYNYSPYMCGQSGGYWSCASKWRTGLAVGAGIEGKLTQNWSAKLEYLYLALPSVATIDLGYPANWNNDAHIVRFGLNYHFR